MRGRQWLVIAVLALAATAGCRKKTNPEYYRLESQVEILVTRSGDDAWNDPGMEPLLAALKAIPADSVEGPKAAALAGRIAENRARLAAEAAALAAEAARPSGTPVPGDLPRGSFLALPEDGGAAPAAAPDAGPKRPTPGMPVKEFLEAFGDCMDQGAGEEVAGLGKATVYRVKTITSCMDRFGVPNDRSARVFLFVNDRLAGDRTETRTVVIVDGGRPPPVTVEKPAPGPTPVYGFPTLQTPDAQ